MRRSVRAAALTASLATVLSGGLMATVASAGAASVGHEKLINTSPFQSRSDHWAGFWATAPAGSTIVVATAEMIVMLTQLARWAGTGLKAGPG
jgi:hypothetical protein